MSRRNPEKKKRPTTITVPERVGPHVKLVFTEMQRQNITYDEVEAGSGVNRPTIKAWRHKNKPNLESIEAVLGFLGFDFMPIPRDRVLAPEIVAALKPVAALLGLTMPQTIAALVEIVSGIHGRFGERRPEPEPIAPLRPAAPRRARPARPTHPDQRPLLELCHAA